MHKLFNGQFKQTLSRTWPYKQTNNFYFRHLERINLLGSQNFIASV